MLEDKVETEVRAHAKQRGWAHRKVKWIGRRGAPDDLFLGLNVGRSFFVEFKKPGKKPRENQDREIAKLRRAGFTVHVIDNIEDGCALFD